MRVKRERSRAPCPSAPSAITATTWFEFDRFHRYDPRGQHIEDRSSARGLAREAHVAGDDVDAAALADAGRGCGNDEASAANGERQEPVARIVRLDDANQADRGVARRRQGQRRIALQVGERARRKRAALLHQDDVVGEPLDLGDVVGDVDDRQRETIAQPFEERQDLALGRPVERRQRLVHEQELRLRHERAADRDPLALAAGEIARRPVEQRRHAEEVGDLVEADRARLRALAARRAEQEVLPYREVRKEARFLEHVAERPAVGRQKGSVPVLPDVAVDVADAVAQAEETGDAAQDRRLAAARGAEQRRHPLGGGREGGVERELADHALERRADRIVSAHARARAKRFSIRIIVRMTAKAKKTMPPARMLASCHCIVST